MTGLKRDEERDSGVMRYPINNTLTASFSSLVSSSCCSSIALHVLETAAGLSASSQFTAPLHRGRPVRWGRATAGLMMPGARDHAWSPIYTVYIGLHGPCQVWAMKSAVHDRRMQLTQDTAHRRSATRVTRDPCIVSFLLDCLHASRTCRLLN